MFPRRLRRGSGRLSFAVGADIVYPVLCRKDLNHPPTAVGGIQCLELVGEYSSYIGSEL